MQYLTNFNILCSNQNGFRKNYSTALAPIDLHDKISTVFDRGEFAVGISPDLSKAFDTVNHAILFYTTEHYDIENVEDLQYLGSYIIPSTGKDIKCRKRESMECVLEIGSCLEVFCITPTKGSTFQSVIFNCASIWP